MSPTNLQQHMIRVVLDGHSFPNTPKPNFESKTKSCTLFKTHSRSHSHSHSHLKH
jgi:hypothetical protein